MSEKSIHELVTDVRERLAGSPEHVCRRYFEPLVEAISKLYDRLCNTELALESAAPKPEVEVGAGEGFKPPLQWGYNMHNGNQEVRDANDIWVCCPPSEEGARLILTVNRMRNKILQLSAELAALKLEKQQSPREEAAPGRYKRPWREGMYFPSPLIGIRNRQIVDATGENIGVVVDDAAPIILRAVNAEPIPQEKIEKLARLHLQWETGGDISARASDVSWHVVGILGLAAALSDTIIRIREKEGKGK